MRVLLVEDDAMLGEAVRTALTPMGFLVDWVKEGAAAQSAASTEPFSAILLDLGLPKKDGLEVLADLRAKGCRVPVILVTARDAVGDRIAGLDTGADDYIVKPFDVSELAARIRAVVRRNQGRAEPRLRAGGIVIDQASREVRKDGELVQLSAREYGVLELLMSQPGVPFSRPDIEARVCRWGKEVDSNAVEVYIYNLRKKLGAGAIHNIRGVGYLVPRD